MKNELFLGRFLNEELTEVPDIDLDFPRDIREKLIPRVHERYGQERSALVAAFATYRARGAIRDLGKALGLPLGEVERFARAGRRLRGEPAMPGRGWRRRWAGCGARSPRWRALAELLPEIAGLPRHISQHPGGMVISTTPLIELCPVQPAAMEGRQIVQWDKDSCADAGFLKIDLLGLGMLSAVERCVDEIARTRGERIDLSRVPLDDDRGVERDPAGGDDRRLPDREPGADADAAADPAREPRRPDRAGGAGAAGADPGRRGPSLHRAAQAAAGGPRLRGALRAPVARAGAAGHAGGDRLPGPGAGGGDGAGRVLGRRGGGAAAGDEPQALGGGDAALPRAVHRGRGRARASQREVAERVFEQIEGFSGFGFPKSHSAAFGLLAYQSTWLRVHYGPELLCALLNEQPMGFYPPDALVHEAQRRGVEILPPDVNASEVDCRVETTGAAAGSAGNPPVRIGLGYVAEVAEVDAEAVVEERRRGGAYRSVSDLAGALGRRRGGAAAAGLGRGVRLAGRGAVAGDRCDPDRGPERGRRSGRPAGLARAEPHRRRGAAGAAARRVPHSRAAGARALGADRGRLPDDRDDAGQAPDGADPRRACRREVLGSEDLGRTRDGTRVEVAGMVVARQRPATANGVVFMLLEDEHGTINLIVPPPVVERCRLAVRTSGFVLAAGKLEHREGTTNVVVSRIDRLQPDELPEPEAAAHRPADSAARRAGPAAVPIALSKRCFDGVREAAMAELAASLPAPHSFGRRGR